MVRNASKGAKRFARAQWFGVHTKGQSAAGGSEWRERFAVVLFCRERRERLGMIDVVRAPRNPRAPRKVQHDKHKSALYPFLLIKRKMMFFDPKPSSPLSLYLKLSSSLLIPHREFERLKAFFFLRKE
ncbi:hypothetical protein B9Q03_13310 [Candidatus Marsarchaeota G2 archaeon OSP_D]|uniref:Uncharacterized protein n=1 Tax=Candidatus Marsarchaeota G2 archaeon OSP_D TaxID=1978157 RepID=A0A2R6ABF9_9ARCH|nr:MAG: hypothetical protein B9Q03_13310 [Candidatus Marsarchaeota G2 archaeon OSP_D]